MSSSSSRSETCWRMWRGFDGGGGLNLWAAMLSSSTSSMATDGERVAFFFEGAVTLLALMWDDSPGVKGFGVWRERFSLMMRVSSGWSQGGIVMLQGGMGVWASSSQPV